MLENKRTYFVCVSCHRASSPGRSEITKCTFLHLCTEGRRFIKTFPIKELLADVYVFAYIFLYLWASLVAQTVKNPPAVQETWFDPWVGKIPWRRAWQPTPIFQYSCLENPHGQRSLMGCSQWGCEELDMTERLSKA